ncbi:MAG: GTP-binding protein [Candidatus Heimdallarchaeota archaeon]
MYIYRDKNLLYKKQFGITSDDLIFEQLIAPLIEESQAYEDVFSKDYYKYRISYTLKNDFLFLFINSLNDTLETIKKELNRCMENFIDLIQTESFSFDDEKIVEKIDKFVFSIQNKFPPIISLVGYSEVGKTTITNLLRTKDIPIESKPTISGNVATLKLGYFYFFIRDFDGDEKIGFLWNNFIRGSDAVLIITDSTLKNVENSKFFLTKIEEEVPYANTGGIGNKQDLEEAIEVSKIREILGLESYPLIAIDSDYRQKMILIITEILKMQPIISPIIDLVLERDKLILSIEEAIKNEDYGNLENLLVKAIDISKKLGENAEPFYEIQLKIRDRLEMLKPARIGSEIQAPSPEIQSRKLSFLERRLKILLKNYMDELESIIAVTICDREGLIITSERKGEAGDEDVLGVIAASVDSYMERIRMEFKEETNFFNITATKDKKFAYCSMGLKSILLTVTDLSSSDTELRIFSEHIAGKVEMIIEGNEKVSLEIPEIVKTLSKTKEGKIPEGDYSLKLIVIGDYEAGKTSLISRFVKNLFKESYQSTIGVEISKKDVELGKNTKIDFAIWDVGGQVTQMIPYRKRFYEGANSAFIVIDRTNEDSINSILKWYNEISKYIGKKINVILIGNKSDLEDQVVISEEQIKKVANQLNFHYILTSAKTGENVNDSFLYVAYRFLELV